MKYLIITLLISLHLSAQSQEYKLKGDFIVTANFKSNGRVGWAIKDAISASLNNGLIALKWNPDSVAFKKTKAEIIQLERVGNKFIMRIANPGEPLQEVGSHEVNLPDEVVVNMLTTNGKAWNTRVDQPVPEGYNPNKEGYVGCRLEILDVITGERNVIHEHTGRFEAPNWMPDGKFLLFNQDGSLWKIPVAGGPTEKFFTGNVDKNNNDHGISFDGKMLAISSSKPNVPGYGSSVFVLPIGGGQPKLITEETPSYWHGWTPDNKAVLYVGQRKESKIFHIYRKSIDGGVETQLTDHTQGHVDGPEFSPDGKYIYYNGNQSGTMQVWRMKPDGSNKEQVTFGENHSWFPHISPDGKWMVFISFPPDIEPNSHPSYKRVTLNLMPLTTGGAPKVIAYLYGGQGTINVPSWSPDSKRIAFVSNSKRSGN
jgi:TolB protein